MLVIIVKNRKSRVCVSENYHTGSVFQKIITKGLCFRKLSHTKIKLPKYPNQKSELVSHLNIDNFEIFDTLT